MNNACCKKYTNKKNFRKEPEKSLEFLLFLKASPLTTDQNLGSSLLASPYWKPERKGVHKNTELSTKWIISASLRNPKAGVNPFDDKLYSEIKWKIIKRYTEKSWNHVIKGTYITHEEAFCLFILFTENRISSPSAWQQGTTPDVDASLDIQSRGTLQEDQQKTLLLCIPV